MLATIGLFVQSYLSYKPGNRCLLITTVIIVFFCVTAAFSAFLLAYISLRNTQLWDAGDEDNGNTCTVDLSWITPPQGLLFLALSALSGFLLFIWLLFNLGYQSCGQIGNTIRTG